MSRRRAATFTAELVEFSILKSIEFPAAQRASEESSGQANKKSLELLLLEKNRTLQSEQTQLKVAFADLESRLNLRPFERHRSNG